MIFNGREFAEKREQELISEVEKWQAQKGRYPKAVFILVGNNQEGERFVKYKCQLAERLKVDTEVLRIDNEVSQKELQNKIKKQGKKDKVDGIVVQLKKKKKYSSQQILDQIPVDKDIDGLTTKAFQSLEEGELKYCPAAVRGLINVCAQKKFFSQKDNWAVAGGCGWLGARVFWALKNILKDKQSIFRVDKETKKTLEDLKNADVIVSACGQPGLITADLVKKGVVIFDLGTMIVEGKSIKGDVAFEEVKQKAGFVTPVPGGMGPVTVVSLFENLLRQ